MLRFVFGFGLVWVALLVWALIDRTGWGWQPPVAEQWPLLVAKLLGVPLVVAWFAIDLAQWRRPRRVFDSRVRAGVAPAAAGVVAGLLSVFLTAAALAVGATGLLGGPPPEPDFYDFGIVTIACVLGAGGAGLFLRRLRAAHCVHCGYNLVGGVGPRCPECGAAGSAA